MKDQCGMVMRKYSFSQRTINEWNKLSTDCVNVGSMNIFKNKVDTSQEGGLNTDLKCWDSRKANGFLVHLPSGPLSLMAIMLNPF